MHLNYSATQPNLSTIFRVKPQSSYFAKASKNKSLRTRKERKEKLGLLSDLSVYFALFAVSFRRLLFK